mmetsp:Transcript_25388/g.82068  ORF Transcript_25388/g.82068 Transcript_25388/m.82068 type:complete len:297 (-) Transcript_25388:1182-2072(-)
MSLNLFGLADDTPDYSLYLCVKELFENAVAACDGGGEHNIRVSVRGLPGVPHLYRVCVCDDGSGFDSQSLAARSLGLVTGSTAGSPSPFDPGASDDPSSARGLTMVLFWANRSYWSRAETGRADDHPSPQAIADITSFSAGFMRKHVWSVDAAGLPTLSTVVVPMGGDTKVTGTQVSAVLLGSAQALGLIYQYIECAQVCCTAYATPSPSTPPGALSACLPLARCNSGAVHFQPPLGASRSVRVGRAQRSGSALGRRRQPGCGGHVHQPHVSAGLDRPGPAGRRVLVGEIGGRPRR